eukprot:Pgem_evm1s12740
MYNLAKLKAYKQYPSYSYCTKPNSIMCNRLSSLTYILTCTIKTTIINTATTSTTKTRTIANQPYFTSPSSLPSSPAFRKNPTYLQLSRS